MAEAEQATTETKETWTPPETKETKSTESESSTETKQTSETETKETEATKSTEKTPETKEAKETKETTSEDSTTSEKSTTESDSEKSKTERVVPAPNEYKLPEGMPSTVGEFAHNTDMTQEQLDKSLEFFGSYLNELDNYKIKQLRQAGESHLEKWGEKKDTNLALVRRTLKTVDKEGGLTKLLDETGYGNHPAVLDFFLQLGQEFKEGGFLPSEVNRPAGKTTAAQALFGKNHPSKHS